METAPQSRRKFITTVALLIATGGLLVRYLTPHTAGKRQVLVTADASDIPPNGALVFSNERVAIIRNEKSIYAVSLICTHLGCTVTVTENHLSCPCHGSLFDRQGAVIKGPADKALKRLELIDSNGVLEVFSS
jgi:Rieske Fe-S protein